MASEDVIANLRVTGEQQFAQAMGRATGETKSVGDAAEQTGKKTGLSKRGLLKAAAGAAVLYKGFNFLKGSINTTQQLAKDAAAFARASGLSTQESQAWVLTAQQRGIQTKQLQVGMATLGRNLGALGGSTKASSAMFEQLGLDQAKLLKMPMTRRMAAIADAFAKLPDGAEKAALAQRVFGRAGQQLLPILNEGGQAMRDQLKDATDLVPPLGENSKQALELAKQQRRANMAMEGLKTTIGTALIPILTPLVKVVTKVVTWFARLVNKSPALKTALVAIAAGLGVAAIAMWALNSAFLASPITWIILAIVAVVVLLIKFWPQLKQAALDAWNWIKQAATDAWNWLKNIAGKIAQPFIDAFNTVKQAVTAAKNWVVARVNDIVGFVKSIPGRIAGLASTAFDAVKTAITGAKDWVRDRVAEVVGFFKDLPGKIKNAMSGLADGIKNVFSKAFSVVAGIVKAPINAVIRGWNSLHFRVPKVDVGPIHFGGWEVGLPHIPELAAGGTMLRSGLALVGERGPELAAFPAGTRITPLPAPQAGASQLTGGDRQVVMQVFLERRMIAEALASFAADQQAAR